MWTSAEGAQANLDFEVDQEAARLIREQGLPIWQALQEALRIVQQKRRAKPYAPKTEPT